MTPPDPTASEADHESLRVPTIGRIVHYTLSASDAERINERRQDALNHLDEHREARNGVVTHVGNTHHEGEMYPMVIVRTWGDGPDAKVNGQVLLDGNHTLWATSVVVGTGPGTWAWPESR